MPHPQTLDEMPPNNGKGKKRAASAAPSPETTRRYIHERQQKRLKEEAAPTPSPRTKSAPTTSNPRNTPRPKPFNPRTPVSKGGSSPRQQEPRRDGEYDDLARDRRIDTLLSRPLDGKEVEQAVQSLLEDSFRHLNSPAHQQPGLAFIEGVIKYISLRDTEKARYAELERYLRQQWRRRMAAFLAGTVTKEDEVKDIAKAFGQRLELDMPHHGFAFRLGEKPPSVNGLLAQLAKRDGGDVPRSSDEHAKGSKLKPLKIFDRKRAARTFSQYTEQLRLMCEALSSGDGVIPAGSEQDKDNFRKLRPDHQRKWLALSTRLLEHPGAGAAGAAPWRLIQEQDVARLIGLVQSTQVITPLRQKSHPSVSPSHRPSPTAIHRTKSGTRACNSPSFLSATTPKPSSSHDSRTSSQNTSRTEGTDHHSSPHLPSSKAVDQPPSPSLRRPSASTRDALHNPQFCRPVFIAHVQQVVRANFNVLFTTNLPGRPDTDVTPLDIFKACQKAFPQQPNGFKVVSPHLAAVSFETKKSADDAVHQVVQVEGCALVAEAVFTKPPIVFAADLGTMSVREGELKHQLAHAFQKSDGCFTVESSTPSTTEYIGRHVIVRFTDAPGHQCCFIPLRARDGASGERHWIWFKPFHPKHACPVCGNKHQLEPCPQLHRLAMPSTYRP